MFEKLIFPYRLQHMSSAGDTSDPNLSLSTDSYEEEVNKFDLRFTAILVSLLDKVKRKVLK
jgi:hypothetical protein